MNLLKSLTIAAGIVLPLSIAIHFWLNEVLFHMLFPGLAVGLLITGGHGGTIGEDVAASIVAPVVNVGCYFLGVHLFRLVWKRATRAQPH